MVFAFNIWHHYIYGVICTIYTDHNIFRYLIDHPILNIKMCMWLDVVNNNDCGISYHPCKVNVVADVLSDKETCFLIWDTYLSMIFVTLLFDMNMEDHQKSDAITEEHQKREVIVGWISTFHIDSRGLLTLHRRFWVPYLSVA